MKLLRCFFLIYLFSQPVSAQISQTALYFNGTNTYVALPALNFFTTLNTNPFTIEAWIRYDDTTQYAEGTIFSTRDETGFTSQGFRISIYDGYLIFAAGGGGASLASNLNDGICHHIAIVRESISSNLIFGYVDGVLVGTLGDPGNISSQILPTIGRCNEPTTFIPFKGLIKELRVWSTVRTQSEIQSNANVVVPYNSTGLLNYWRFNEGSGTTINNYATFGGGTGTVGGSAGWTTGCFGCTPPVATITYNTPITLCYGSNVVLNAPTGTGYTYVWRKNNVLTSNTGSSITVSTPGNYTVQITNLCGTSTSNPVTVTVIYHPSTNIYPSTATTRCSFANLQANAGAGFIYQWKKNGLNIAGATSHTYTATTNGNYSFTINNGCTTLTSVSVAITIVTSVPSTPGTITVSGGNSKVCPGDSRTYSISSLGNATSYTWTAPQGGIIQSGQGTASVIVAYNSNFTVSDTVRVKANNVCGSSNFRKLVVVRNNPSKPSVISGAVFGLCNASAVPYSVTNVSGITYNWSFSVGNTQIVSGQTTNAITANFTSGFLSGILNVTANNACGTSSVRTQTVYAKPSTPSSITGPSLVCLNQQNVAYSITPVAGVTSYTWGSPTGATVSDGIVTSNLITTTSTAVQVDFATTAGNVRVRGNNSCASGSYRAIAVTFNCRVPQNELEEETVSVYPNPFDDELNFIADGFKEVRIYNEQGQEVYYSSIKSSGEKIKPELTDGVYMINLLSETEIKTFRVVRLSAR